MTISLRPYVRPSVCDLFCKKGFKSIPKYYPAQPRVRPYAACVPKHNEELFSKVSAPQEAVRDAMVIKQISWICRLKAEQMSSNIAQFRYEEYAERLVASMRGEGGQQLARRKWVLL